MALPDYSMRQLLEAGVHFGHQSHRWNPKMAPYIFGIRNNIHIIDLAQTVPMLARALQAMSDTVAKGGRILFVGTKRQASERHRRCRQALGAVLRQLALARRHAHQLEDHLQLDRAPEEDRGNARPSEAASGYTKKERLTLSREKEKLERALGGIRDMGGLPDLVFVIDTNKEDIAIKEARAPRYSGGRDRRHQLQSGRHHVPDPGQRRRRPRDRALLRSRRESAAIDGISRAQGEAGVDLGAAEKPPVEELPAADRSGKASSRLPGPRGAPDDLKKLAGVSPDDREAAQRSRYLPLTRRSPNSTRRMRTSPRRRRSACPAASTAGSRRRRRFRPRPNEDVMAEITCRSLVKELREQDRRRHDGLQGGAHRDQWRPRGRGRLAAQEGPVEGREEGRPRRRRRPRSGSRSRASKGVVVEVNSETDFVARNDHFQGLVKLIAQAALHGGADVEKLKVVEGRARDDRRGHRRPTIATIGENMTLRRAASLSVGDGAIGSYVHGADRRGSRQDRRAGRARIEGRRDELAEARPHGRDAHRGRQSAGGRCGGLDASDH